MAEDGNAADGKRIVVRNAGGRDGEIDKSGQNIRILSRFRDEFLDKVLECARQSEHLKSPYLEPVYKAIETYVVAHNLHLSDEPGATTRQYRIFGARIFFHANDLAGIIADIIPYVRMNTVVREKEFDIQIDGARVVYLYNIDPTFAKIISPCDAEPSLATCRIPAEVELVDIYHRIYSPDQHSSWDMLRKYEDDLWRSFITTRARVSECDMTEQDEQDDDTIVIKKQLDRRGDGRSRSKSPKPRASGGLEDAHSEIVLRWLATQREYAIVGNFALTCMNGKQCPTTGAMQIIVGDTSRAIASLSNELSKYIPKAKIESRKYDLQLPTDYRIKKYVILARVGRDVYYIANLFNCASFELVPYVSIAGIKVATQDVILRFLLIELWFVRVVHGFGKMTRSEYVAMVKSIFANADNVRASWVAHGPVVAQPTYIGTYVNETISKKSEDMIPPYYPAQYKAEHGSYRKLA
jgi:hypothetical protein